MKAFKCGIAAALAALLGLCASAPLQAQDDSSGKRVISVKSRVVAKGSCIRLKDIAVNGMALTEAERELEVIEAPTDSDQTIGIVDLAYMLQRYPELMNLRLKGPRTIILQKASDSSAIDKAKGDIVQQIKGMAPWKDWEIDVILSASDESSISKAWPFSKVELLPSENKTMIGSVNLNVAFVDANGRQSGKCILSPTILKKVGVVVLNSNCRQGQILGEGSVKKVPMWLGPENKDYVTELDECLGREIAKSMSAGEIVRSNDILNPVCAKKGDMVWVECRSGALSVRLAVTALEGGRQGDMIKVLNQPTQKTFSIQLTGEKQGYYRMGS